MAVWRAKRWLLAADSLATLYAGGRTIRFWASSLSGTKQTIASQLNMTPESLSRVLNRFRRTGCIIPRGHRSIRLTEYDGLQSLAA